MALALLCTMILLLCSDDNREHGLEVLKNRRKGRAHKRFLFFAFQFLLMLVPLFPDTLINLGTKYN